MDYAAVVVAALVVSALALYSGFGLGTLLMPVFALFFPIPVAVASTAAVHLANNVFRVTFVGRGADWRIVLLFGLPAAALAVPGAFLLVRISDVAPLASYSLGNVDFEIQWVKLVVAALILAFASFELVPKLRGVNLPRRFVPYGGALSGFFGGVSGHQGALRSAVLANVGLDTTAFVGTVSVCAFMVDVSRLAVYGATFFADDFTKVSEGNSLALVGAAIVAVFLGTYFSSLLLKSVTMAAIRRVVGVMLVGIALALASGLL